MRLVKSTVADTKTANSVVAVPDDKRCYRVNASLKEQLLMEEIPSAIRKGKPLLMDKAYEGDACRAKAKKCGRRPVVPLKNHRKEP